MNGPGLGLTRALLMERTPRLIAIEKDKRVISFLQHLVDAADNRLELVEEDALKLKIADICTEPVQIIANLPYNIATPLLVSFLNRLNISSDELNVSARSCCRITLEQEKAHMVDFRYSPHGVHLLVVLMYPLMLLCLPRKSPLQS